MSFLGKVKKKLRNGSWYPFYNTFYEKNNLDPHMILLESRSGKALESNILSLLKELCQEPYRSFTLVLSVHRDSENEIKEKLQKNSIQGVRFVRTGSVAYYHALSRAGYLVNDTSFPGRFIKKEGQIYLNTWHGTPLKKMGRDNRPEMVTMGNVQRNLLDSDYLVFPNQFMEEKMSGAYMLDSLYRGTVLREGYPRNDIFRQPANLHLKEQVGLQGKKLLAYLPTFRGNFNALDDQGYMQTLSQNLSLWDSQLNEDEILLIKLHPFLHGLEDFSGYHHILPFPASWDTYEGLSVCDTLITDYSSVFYDYANSGKKSYFLPMTARNMKVPVVCMKQSIPILLIILKKQRRSFHLHTAPVAHRTMLLCKNMPAMKTDTVPKRSVVRSSFMRTAAVSTNIMAMVKKIF